MATQASRAAATISANNSRMLPLSSTWALNISQLLSPEKRVTPASTRRMRSSTKPGSSTSRRVSISPVEPETVLRCRVGGDVGLGDSVDEAVGRAEGEVLAEGLGQSVARCVGECRRDGQVVRSG